MRLVPLLAVLLCWSGTALAQCPPHTPAFPLGNANLAPRQVAESALIIRVQYESVTTTWPDQAEANQLITYVDQLAKNNAYSPAGYEIDFIQNGSLPYFNVYPPAPLPMAGAAHLLTILRAFDQQYPAVPIDQCDHVIIFRPQDPMSPAGPSNAAGYITYPQNFEPDPSSADPMREAAAGVFHEIGHKYGLGHANLHREPAARRLNYGDIYDFMGGMGPRQWRFDESLWPLSPPAPVFADPLVIHANPMVKRLHWWIDANSIVRDTDQGTEQHAISGISQSSGVLAVEIPREELPNVAYSLMVYWRDNEPQMSGGASVAIVSPNNIRATTRLVELNRGPVIAGGARFPGWEPTLLPGASWTDPVSGVQITCDGFDPISGNLLVTVTRPVNFDFARLPYLDIIAPALDGLQVQRNGDTVCVSVNAGVRDDLLPEVPFADITNVDAELRVSEGATARVLRVGSATGPEARFTFTNPTDVWSIDISSLVDPMMPTTPVQEVAAVRVTAFSIDSKRTIGQRLFLIDQTAQ
ncbi:MAG: hypothetical protein AAF628_13020 [Planctomycetota bacterium]